MSIVAELSFITLLFGINFNLKFIHNCLTTIKQPFTPYNLQLSQITETSSLTCIPILGLGI